MDQREIGQLRLKQVGIMNGAILIMMLIFYVATMFYPIKFSHFFFVLGTIVIFQGIFGLVKGNSTKSFIPHAEKIAIYEKEKMGNEWWKLRKVAHIWNLFFGLILFLQAYVNKGTGQIYQIDLLFMIIMVCFILVLLNIGMILHFRKVDRASSVMDFKGYSGKQT